MQTTAQNYLEIYTDGASRGNPGDTAWAFVVCSGTAVIREDAGYLGTGTNNEAEYQAVIHALNAALDEGHPRVALYSDSELVIRQIRGEYRVRAEHLKPLYKETKDLIGRMKYFMCHAVPRDHPCIRHADRLCNQVLDRAAIEKIKTGETGAGDE